MKRLLMWWQKRWIGLNYRYCKSNAYLAAQRNDWLESGEWESQASRWQRDYLMVGRSLITG